MYSLGNLKLCDPVDETLGRFPALGITFQDRVRVTFWWFLKDEEKENIGVIEISIIRKWQNRTAINEDERKSL